MAKAMGVTLHTGDLDIDEILRYAQEAESLGYEGLWLTEESGKEAFAVLALLARATQRIRLATGIVNFYSRTPTLLAMGAMTCVDPNDEAAVNAMRRGLAFYFASEHYHHIAEISGFGPQAKQVKAVWESGDFHGASRLVTDAMVEKFSLTGTSTVCRKKLRWMLDAGVYPIIYPLPRHDRMAEDHFATIRLAMSHVA